MATCRATCCSGSMVSDIFILHSPSQEAIDGVFLLLITYMAAAGIKKIFRFISVLAHSTGREWCSVTGRKHSNRPGTRTMKLSSTAPANLFLLHRGLFEAIATVSRRTTFMQLQLRPTYT